MSDPIITVPGELTSPPPDEKGVIKHANDAVRLAFVIASTVMASINLTAFTIIADWPPALLKKVAVVSGYPTLIGWMFLVCFAAAVPYVVIQCVAPMCRWRTAFTRWSSFAHVVAGVMWAGMAIVSVGLDYSYYGVVLWLDAVTNLAFGFALGMSNNHELLRALAHERWK